MTDLLPDPNQLMCFWSSKHGGCYACDTRDEVLVIKSYMIETRYCRKHLKEIAGNL